MAENLTPVVPAGQGTALGPVFQQARDYFDQAKASATRKSYARDWRHFVGWCQGHARTALPAEPDTVGLYLTDLAGTLKVATLAKRVAALSQAHQFAGHPSLPTTSWSGPSSPASGGRKAQLR